MLVPYNAGGEAAAPIARLAKAALEQGLYLMTHWNVVMVVPPLTITPEEAEEGVAILDEVLAIADADVASDVLTRQRRRPAQTVVRTSLAALQKRENRLAGFLQARPRGACARREP